MKLLSYLQTFHNFARRKAVQAIKDAQILVNGKRVESYQMELEIGDKLTIRIPGASIVEKKVESFGTAPAKLILFHKPVGYVVSKSDPHNQTIYFLLPESLKSYDYIGRLDKDSTWLLLLTNDKKKVHELGHPSSNVLKTYVVRVDAELTEDEIAWTKKWLKVDEDGELLESEKIKIAEKAKKDLEAKQALQKPLKANRNQQDKGKGQGLVEPEDPSTRQFEPAQARSGWQPQQWELLKFESVKQEAMKGYVELTIKLVEWHKRHIRRLLRALGKKVFELHRISFGDYDIGKIRLGEREVAREPKEKFEKQTPQKNFKYKK